MSWTRESLLDLLSHMEWADARVWTAVPLSGTPDTQLRDLLGHLHGVQKAFLAVWTNTDFRTIYREPDSFATLDEVRTWARVYYPEARAFIAGASDDNLTSTVTLPWARSVDRETGVSAGPTTLAETCVQVASHSTYHRAQVNTRLRELGIAPPAVDYIAWLWSRRPAPGWPT